MRRAICPGSYDPATNGHLDIIERAARQFDEVVVAVLINKTKTGLFEVSDRMAMLKEITEHLPGVRVDCWHGLLVDYCTAHGIATIVKGLRAVSDFDYELQMAQLNYQLSGVDTMFLPSKPHYSFLSSSVVKEVATYGGDVGHLLPATVHQRLITRLADEPR
ncbi:MAG TPA: pantetheine-phosphate adenylyltransferase [Pseudonocardiaceae bacterium]|jgi:pantetheine-phosphate adenylyltransferase|nr:pantetheine-phosphate adenylyltransferase [Pseudonocardiaceae bacterium]